MQNNCRRALPIIFLLFLVGCGDKTVRQARHDPPQILAQEQWDKCSRFPSVELVEISAEGKVVIRDRHFSTPPVAFQHCLANVAYDQVLSGRRSARSLIREAYFTDNAPRKRSLAKTADQYPQKSERFSPGQTVILFYTMEAPNRPIDVFFEWITPAGENEITQQRIGPANDKFPMIWSTERFKLKPDDRGRWSVRIFVEGFPAGEYTFRVL